jgi:hypothetical protein
LVVVIVTTVIILLSAKALKDIAKGTYDLSSMGELKIQNVVFKPIDPGADDNELERYFSAEMENEAEAHRLIDQLMALEEVEAAYVKPKSEPPK